MALLLDVLPSLHRQDDNVLLRNVFGCHDDGMEKNGIETDHLLGAHDYSWLEGSIGPASQV